MKLYVQFVIGLLTVIALSHTAIARPQNVPRISLNPLDFLPGDIGDDTEALIKAIIDFNIIGIFRALLDIFGFLDLVENLTGPLTAGFSEIFNTLFSSLTDLIKDFIIEIASLVGLGSFFTKLFQNSQLDDIISLNELLDIVPVASYASSYFVADGDLAKVLSQFETFPCTAVLTALEIPEEAAKAAALETALTSTAGNILDNLVAAAVPDNGIDYAALKTSLETGDVKKILDVLYALNLVKAGADSIPDDTYDITTIEAVIDKINLLKLGLVLNTDGPLHETMDFIIVLSDDKTFNEDLKILDDGGSPVFDYALVATALVAASISDICTQIDSLNEFYPFVDLNAAIDNGEVSASFAVLVTAQFGSFIDEVAEKLV